MAVDPIRGLLFDLQYSKWTMMYPNLLLFAAVCLLGYNSFDELSRKNPLAEAIEQALIQIVLQMVPLVILKHKIRSCPDRGALLSTFAMKVLCMHYSFITLNFSLAGPLHVFLGDVSTVDSYVDFYFMAAAFLVIALILLFVFDVQCSMAFFSELRDVWSLIIIGIAAGAVQNIFHMYGSTTIGDFLVNTANTLETLSFMPALYVLYRMNAMVEVFTPIKVITSQRRALSFFLFLFVYYAYEDVYSPWTTMRSFPVLLAVKGCHIAVLLDFGIFVLSQAEDHKAPRPEEFSQQGTALENPAGVENGKDVEKNVEAKA